METSSFSFSALHMFFEGTGNSEGWYGSKDPLGKNIRLVGEIRIFGLCIVAALTWVIYDILICTDKEVALVWNRWKEPRGRHNRRLYLLVRYFPLITLIAHAYVNAQSDLSINVCKGYLSVMVVTTTLLIGIPDLMMLIRINSIYDWSLKPMALTIGVILVNVTTGLLLGLSSANNFRLRRETMIPVQGCFKGSWVQNPLYALGAWIPAIAGQCVYFCLMVNTLFHIMRVLDENGRASFEGWVQVRKLVPTMMIFIRHGIWYFFVGVAAKIFCVVMITATRGPLRLIGIIWIAAIYPTLVARVYLDMVAYLYTRKRQHKIEARPGKHRRRRRRRRISINEDGSSIELSDLGVDAFDADDFSEDEGPIRFSYNSHDYPKNGLEPITFAKRTSFSVYGGEGEREDLESVKSLSYPKAGVKRDFSYAAGQCTCSASTPGKSRLNLSRGQSTTPPSWYPQSSSHSIEERRKSQEQELEERERKINQDGWEKEFDLESLAAMSQRSRRSGSGNFGSPTRGVSFVGPRRASLIWDARDRERRKEFDVEELTRGANSHIHLHNHGRVDSGQGSLSSRLTELENRYEL
ncbi:hypothetical protein CPB83DRAFT_905628 [Crepidotus variabilis]|uniref:DUF6533 domain-containing protein n=1 Tax=Crepidotus variabilis TaxID=179855 RepID=A0A9P6EK28_9AGAR|nr:hypothetical protein CPB83DRAFT_905628 [Crepidotus variabilis]